MREAGRERGEQGVVSCSAATFTQQSLGCSHFNNSFSLSLSHYTHIHSPSPHTWVSFGVPFPRGREGRREMTEGGWVLQQLLERRGLVNSCLERHREWRLLGFACESKPERFCSSVSSKFQQQVQTDRCEPCCCQNCLLLLVLRVGKGEHFMNRCWWSEVLHSCSVGRRDSDNLISDSGRLIHAFEESNTNQVGKVN
jgi:hypothetical protein